MKIAASLVALLVAGTALADTPRVLPVFREGIVSDFVGVAGIQTRHDVSGDGFPDIVTCSNGNAFALAKRGNGFETVWYSEQIACNGIRTADRNGDSFAEIFVATGSSGAAGAVLIYDPRSYGPPIGTITVPANKPVNDVAIGDPDQDGKMEIAAITDDAMYLYDANTLVLEWTAAGKGGFDVAIANIDDDARAEVVVNGTIGRILDAANQVEKWGYAGGFGNIMAVGNVDSDPRHEILFARAFGQQVTVVEGDAMTSSTVALSQIIDSMNVGDANGDGIDEIIAGNNQWGDIIAYRRSDGSKVWEIDNPDHGTHAVALGDVDADGVIEAVWGAGGSSTARDVLHVASTATKQIEWTSPDYDQAFHTATADLDGDGTLELIVGITGMNGGYNGGRVEIRDLRTRALEGTLANIQGQGQYLPSVYGIAVGQLDADPAKEILVLGESVYAWDGVTLAHQWTASTTGISANSVVIMNVDADPVDEIFLGLNGSQVVVLNGASPVIQWSSPRLEEFFISDIAVADVNANGLFDVVVGTSQHLYVFEIPTGTQRLKVPLGSIISVAATSSDGGHIAAGYGNTRTRMYAGTTLTQEWECTTSDVPAEMVFGNVGGRFRLAAGTTGGNLRFFTPGGSACPGAETKKVGRTEILDLSIDDLTGDGRGDVLFAQSNLYGLYLAGWESEPRGDMNADGLVTDADIDALVAYLLGGSPGAPPSGDVNADGRITLEDVFKLIDYRRGTGSAPPP